MELCLLFFKNFSIYAGVEQPGRIDGNTGILWIGFLHDQISEI